MSAIITTTLRATSPMLVQTVAAQRPHEVCMWRRSHGHPVPWRTADIGAAAAEGLGR